LTALSIYCGVKLKKNCLIVVIFAIEKNKQEVVVLLMTLKLRGLLL